MACDSSEQDDHSEQILKLEASAEAENLQERALLAKASTDQP